MGREASEKYERTNASGQMVLHDFEAIMGFESAKLKKHRHELFCLEFVNNGGYAGKAYKSVSGSECSDDTASKHASRLIKNDEIRRRISELSAVIRNRALNKLIDYRLRAIDFDPAKYTGKSGAIRIEDVAEADRIGVGLESKIVDGCLYYLPVFPSPEKAADALQKIMGLDKASMELTGKNGGPVEMLNLSPMQKAARVAHLLAEAKKRQDAE